MRYGTRASLGAAIMSGLTAQAAMACPTGADLATGIEFFNPDGLSEVHSTLDDGRIQIDLLDPTGDSIRRNILVHGVYLQWVGYIENGRSETLSSYSYQTPVDELPMPEPGLRWSGVQSEISGTEFFARTIGIEIGDARPWQLEECTYEALPVTVKVRDETEIVYSEQILYLPALGTGVLINYSDQTGAVPIEFLRVAAVADGG